MVGPRLGWGDGGRDSGGSAVGWLPERAGRRGSGMAVSVARLGGENCRFRLGRDT